MAYAAFSDEWARAFGERIRSNEAYRRAAASWEWPMIFLVRQDPQLGIREEMGVYLDLYRGECREARTATAAELASAPYVLSADAYTWKQVLDGKLEPIGAMMRGKVKVARGSLVTLARYVVAAKCLVDSATEVPTDFPEGLQ